MITPSNKPAFYFPPSKGLYEVKPGLIALQTDFGNGAVDKQVFQFDDQFKIYRDNKIKASAESVEKYICINAGVDLASINHFIAHTLSTQHPGYFSFNQHTNDLNCHLTDKQIQLNKHKAFEELGMQVQEDLAVMQIDESGDGKVIALHLCAPNHWAAQDKIGKDFVSIHSPVPGMERINQRNREINNACLNKGPFVRFAWGLSADKFLNHHPQPSPGIPVKQWQGRQFNAEQPELYMRVERQTLQGFLKDRMVLFTIRTYFYDVMEISQQHKRSILDAIHSMDETTLNYKGLVKTGSNIIHWLEQEL